MDRFENIPETALRWHQEGKGAVLATVVETWGSAPRRVGGQLVINRQGEMEGSVSGGCVEGAVVLEAIEALEKGTHMLLEYGISDGDAFAVGLACGGTIRILVEPIGDVMPVSLLEQLVEARANRRAVAYVVNVKTGVRALVSDGYDARFRLDRSGFEEDQETFVGIHNPPLRMVIVGAVHIAQALVPMARIAGFDPYLIDPRESFGSSARFPDTPILDDWPDEAMEKLGADARTALVLLTHDPKLDDPALEIGLKSDLFYIGALGSSRTHAKRVDRLSALGFTDDQIGRIHGPVGLACGGTIRILVEPIGDVMPVSLLEQLVEARATRRAVAYVVNVKTGTRALVSDGYDARFRMDRSGFEADQETFVGIHNPPLRMVIVGAVHIAQALVPMARIAGFDPYLIDPRESFGSSARFPDTPILDDWPDEAMEKLGADARTALVLLTHDPKLDDPALEIGLKSDLFYIGALGSSRTHAKRVDRLSALGFTDDQIGRIHGPVGLNIGAATPAEIAVSIMAEVLAQLRVPK